MTKTTFDSLLPQMKLVVKAIQKAVGEDSREYRQSSNLETNNAARFLISDYINTNIKNSVVSESLEQRKFPRFGWEGCILIDRVNKFTFSVCSEKTLERTRKDTDRKYPHYLQTILNVENSEVKANPMQLMLFDMEPVQSFSPEEYALDYAKVMGTDVFPEDGYTHWVIAYSVYRYNLESISMLKYDKNFQLSEEVHLEDLLLPDFGDLTMDDTTNRKPKDVYSLVKVREPVTRQSGVDDTMVRIAVKSHEEEKEA